MSYAIIALILILLILVYFKIADYYNIIDKPNERSSHSNITIRGGGIIFPLASLLWFLAYEFQYPFFITGLMAISAISLIDDIYTISVKPRLFVHFASVALLLYELGIFNYPILWLIIAFIMVIGWINAFNFMDGINGITVFYALVTLSSLAWVNNTIGFIDHEFLFISIIGGAVFGFFNARKKAKTFAGDIGSVSMAFIIAFSLTRLMIHTGRWEYILFVCVYGVDSVITIFQRLLKKENIFKPHRTHLYQYLANEMSISHIAVASLYAIIQLIINIATILMLQNQDSYSQIIAICILLGVGVFYLLTKKQILAKIGVLK